jgi:hypothetical protein
VVTAEIVAPGVYKVDAIALKNTINVLLLENDDGWTLVDSRRWLQPLAHPRSPLPRSAPVPRTSSVSSSRTSTTTTPAA